MPQLSFELYDLLDFEIDMRQGSSLEVLRIGCCVEIVFDLQLGRRHQFRLVNCLWLFSIGHTFVLDQ